MSKTQTIELRHEPTATGTTLAVDNHHCWPDNALGSNGFYEFNINVEGATIQGAGIRTHGCQRVFVTSDYPDGSGNWKLTVFNMEGQLVSFDVYAWYT